MSTYTLSRRKFSAVYAAGASSGTPGTALANGKLWLTVAGGTYNNSADYMAAYTDYTSGTPVTRDGDGAIVLDAAGETEIWYEGLADIRVASSTDELQYTQDSVPHAMPNVVTGNANILPNGSFEQDSDADGTPDDWTLTQLGTITMDNTAGNSTHGEYALKFTGSGAGGGWADSVLFPVSNIGKLLRVQWEFKQTTASNGSYTVELFWYDNTQSLLSSSLISNVTSGAPTVWTKYHAGVEVPSTATWAKLRVTGLGPAGSDKAGDCWYDNVGVFQDNGGWNQSAPQATTSGNNVSFDSIPNWAQEIKVTVMDISTNGTATVYLRFKSGGSLSTNIGSNSQITGTNTCVVNNFADTVGIPIMQSSTASTTRYGQVVIQNMNPGTDTLWAGQACIADGSGDTMTGAFKVGAAAQYIDEIDLNTTDTFDGGSFIVSWKG